MTTAKKKTIKNSSRNYGVSDIENWTFEDVALPKEWKDHLGEISEPFKMIIEGPSGHGKTEYVFKLMKVLVDVIGKVNFNSTEQGKSKTFKAAWDRNQMGDIAPGKFMLAKKKTTFELWYNDLCRPNSGRVIVLDSIDYLKMTDSQFKQLIERFEKKNIIVVCWNDPMAPDSKKIKYMCDIKVEVKDFKARIRSRFGGNKPFVIWPEAGQALNNQLRLL